MPAPVAILFGAAFTVAVSFALGSLLLRRWKLPLDAGEERMFAFVTGAALLSVVVFFLCAAGLARPAIFLLCGAAVLAAATYWRTWRSSGKPGPPLSRVWKWIFAAGFAAYFVLYFFNAMAPEISPDGTAYHLGLTARYLREHGFVRNATNIYAAMPGGMEMLFLFAFAFGRHSAAALVHFAFLCALVWAVLLYGRRFGTGAAGAFSAVMLMATPVAGIDAASAYNDVALACAGFCCFYLLQIWDAAPEQDRRVPFAAGLLAGFAYALKYTGAVVVIYALGFLAWRSWRRRARVWPAVSAAAVAALILMLPWMAKNWLWVQNPFSPFANRWFPNPFVHLLFEQQYARQLRNPAYYGLKSWTEIPLALTVNGSLTGILGPLYLLAPLGLLAVRARMGRRLLLAGTLFAVPYAANLGCRFLIPALPFFALALGAVLTRVPALAVPVILLHGWISWPDIVNRYYPPSNFHLHKIPLPQALRIRSEEEFLRWNVETYAQAELLDRVVPPGAKVLSFDPTAEAYTSRDVLVVYQSAFNETARDILFAAMNPDYTAARQVQFHFPAQTFRRVRVVVDAARGSEPFCIHELRFFRDGAELERAPGWRLRARPNRWDVQMAFDNSPVTRWRSWQPPAPGMFVEADFGAPRAIDTVRVERSGDQRGITLRLEGDSKPVAARLEQKIVPAPPRLRQAAAQELQARGIRYLLVNDSNLVADDFWVNRAAWRLTLAGQAGGARLYRLDAPPLP